MFDSATWLAKPRHRIRRRMNLKYRLRDQFHGKAGRRDDWLGRQWRRRRFEPDWTFERAKTHSETGYGVAYIRNPKLNEM